MLVKFVQGAADGGGIVVPDKQILKIKTRGSPEMLRKVLTKLGIPSTLCGNEIIIDQPTAIIDAARLPIFFAAREKQIALERLARTLQESAP